MRTAPRRQSQAVTIKTIITASRIERPHPRLGEQGRVPAFDRFQVPPSDLDVEITVGPVHPVPLRKILLHRRMLMLPHLATGSLEAEVGVL